MDELSHVEESGAVRMVDVGAKEPMRRRAVARAEEIRTHVRTHDIREWIEAQLTDLDAVRSA